jgi:hypothetical protein
MPGHGGAKHTVPGDVRHAGLGPLENLAYMLLETATAMPDKAAIATRGSTVTYADLAARSR